MATLADFDRTYIEAKRSTDGATLREDVRYHARERIAFTLKDRVRADIIAERDATDGASAKVSK